MVKLLNRKSVILCSILVFLTGFLIHLVERFTSPSDHLLKNLSTLYRMYKIVRASYVDDVNSDELFQGAMRGMVSMLDKHSALFSAKEASDFHESLDGRYLGLGIMLQPAYPDKADTNGSLLVTYVFNHTPAQKSGLKEGDIIERINDIPAKGMPCSRFCVLLRQEQGNKLQLGVSRNGDKLTIPLVISKYTINNLTGPLVLPNTTSGYCHINSFNEKFTVELPPRLKLLVQEKKIDSFILDLRGNGGGLIPSAASLCSMFLQENDLIVTVVHKNNGQGNADTALLAKSSQEIYKVPRHIKLAVLIDKNSASASELTAACLQDWKRAIIVGEKSYGKGSIQHIFQLDENNELKITVARYQTKNKMRIVDGVGVTPDIVVDIPPKEMNKLTCNIFMPTYQPEKDPVVLAALKALDNEPNRIDSEPDI